MSRVAGLLITYPLLAHWASLQDRAGWAPVALCSWFANVLGYVFTPALFLAEYAVRRLWLREVPHLGLIAYIRRLAGSDVRSVIRS